MEILFNIIWTLVLLGLIVLSCAVFTNAIEWAGHRFNLSEGAVGSVLAAVGTALPETLVPLVAIVSGLLTFSEVGQAEGEAIGIGAILGAPFLLSTLAMHVSAVAVFYFAATRQRTLTMHLDEHLFRRDLLYFFAAYTVVFLSGFIADRPVKLGVALALLVFYGIYVYRTIKKEHISDTEFDLDPLYFGPNHLEPPGWLIFVQVFAGLLGILIMAHLFVEDVTHLSQKFHLDPLVLSLIITPIATELPEKFNSVLWLRKKKDNLALGNITGAMVFQSCIPGAIGLALTPWVLSEQGILSVLLCLGSSLVLFFGAFLKKAWTPYVLLSGGLFYLVFIIYSLTRLGVVTLPLPSS